MIDLPALYDFAAQHSVGVYWFSLDATESLSYMDADGTCYIAMDPWWLRTLAVEKTKLAHELGHCETGSFYNRYAKLDLRQKHENRADKWAIQHLIPVEELDEAVADGYTDLPSLAEHFCVTVPLCARPSAGIPTVIWPWRCMLERPRWPCVNL